MNCSGVWFRFWGGLRAGSKTSWFEDRSQSFVRVGWVSWHFGVGADTGCQVGLDVHLRWPGVVILKKKGGFVDFGAWESWGVVVVKSKTLSLNMFNLNTSKVNYMLSFLKGTDCI